MNGLYGKHFADLWAGSDLEAVKDVWSKRLAGYSKEELIVGLVALGKKTYCPTLPEFMLLCRPPLEYHTAFLDAVHNLELRPLGKDVWHPPALYWAAVRVGVYDMRHIAYSGLEKRWKKALDDVMACECQPVPEAVLALPSAGKSVTTNEEGLRRITEMADMLREKMVVKND